MPEKDPSSYTWLTYLWVGGLAVAGGFVSWIQKVRRGESRPFNIPELLGELVTSGFVGILTFFLCESAGVGQPLAAFLVGVAGHMGSRALFLAEGYVEKWVKRKF